VLDVGCGAGALGETLLQEGRASSVHGIEIESDAAALARQSLDEVFEINLEDHDELAHFVALHEHCYDVMVLADVLEHVREPEIVLQTLIDTVAKGGLVITSIPNIRSTGVLVPLLFRGRFDYRDRGVLDRTHLRFFTRRTAIELLEGADLEIIAVERSQAWWRTGVRRLAGRLLGDLGTEQFLITARRPA
jgi:2-polyprenyl-3-methyl-5-hydroxy-6-metoxy-1,4-benzoquinol methylase